MKRLKKVGLSIEGEKTDSSMISGSMVEGVTESKASALKEKFCTGKDKIINFFREHNLVFREHNLVLVLDDFHYAPEAMQFDMAYQLKDAIRKEFKTVIISLPHRADDSIRKNADLSGRLNLINIEPWQESALREIALTGYHALGVDILDELVSDLARESLTSPQLMQSICLNLCFLLGLDKDASITEIKERSKLEEAYRITTLNLPYKDVVRRLKAGPPTRGQKRGTYTLSDGEEADIYSLLLKAIAIDPPIISISLEEVKRRIDTLLSNAPHKPDKKKIKSAIEQVQAIIDTSESIYQVFEWKDEGIYILDPLFLFYLRWGKY